MIAAPDRFSWRKRWLLGLTVPAAALMAFSLVVLAWAADFESVPIAALRILGVPAASIPLLDTSAILAAAECQRSGTDVYLFDPCDLLGRPHVYSPLWLALVPPGLGIGATPRVGVVLDLLFILALPILTRARRKSEVAIFALAVFSPMTLFALERGNNDLVIFLMVLVAALFLRLSRAWRFCAYGVFILGALLKYYPAVLLALAGRERRRDAIVVASAFAAAVAAIVFVYHDTLLRAFSNIPRPSYYMDSFSARNLPFGLATGLPLPHGAAILVAIVLFAALSALAFACMLRSAELLVGGINWIAAETQLAAIGALLVVGCFFAGQNINYRGIYFLFILPGLLEGRHTAKSRAAMRLLSLLIAAILLVMWDEFFRHALIAAPDVRLRDQIDLLFWAGRELVWWWLVAVLAGFILGYLAQLPLYCEAAGWLAARIPRIRW